MDTGVEHLLPPGWIECHLGDVTLPVQKIDPNYDPDQEITYIDISGIDNIRNIVQETKRFRLGDAPSRARQIVRSGDVLFATVRPYLRNIASVPDKYDGQIASTGFSVLRPAQGIDPSFLYYKAISSDFVSALSGEQYGVSYPAVKDEQVRAQPLQLPPTKEQERIVAKIKELFSELDKGVESLATARGQLKVYRQIILKHAFEGKLTEQWREDNKHKLETSEHLLARIKKERESRYEKQLEEWNAAVKAWEAKAKPGKKPAKPRTPKPLVHLNQPELAELPNLPGLWFWDRLGWMTCGVEYGTAAKSSESGEVPVLRMGNIQNAKLDWVDLAYTSDPTEIEQYSLRPGDVLFNRTNSPELVGKSAIYRGEQPALFAGYLIRVNQNPVVIDCQYLNLFLNSHVAKQHGNKVKTDGVNQSNINGEKLQNYPFPYCSLAEQHEIVRILDEKLSVIDQLENDIDQELVKAQALRHSILKRAFSGQLVEQDPNDEPASALLERVRAEKTELSNNKKNSKRKDAA